MHISDNFEHSIQMVEIVTFTSLLKKDIHRLLLTFFTTFTPSTTNGQLCNSIINDPNYTI